MTLSQYDANSKPLFMKLHILDLQKLIIHRIALMNSSCSILLPVPVSNLFIKNSSIHGYNTRSCNMLHTKIGSSEVTYTNFSYHGVHIWNIMERNIPPSISYITVSNTYQKNVFKKMTYIIDCVQNLKCYNML